MSPKYLACKQNSSTKKKKTFLNLNQNIFQSKNTETCFLSILSMNLCKRIFMHCVCMALTCIFGKHVAIASVFFFVLNSKNNNYASS